MLTEDQIALFNAASENDASRILALLNNREIDHNTCINQWGAMPIHHAAWNGKLTAIKTLAAFNRELLKVKTVGGWSVLDTAVGSEHLTTENKMKTIDALIEAGLDISPFLSDIQFLERHARFPQIVDYLKKILNDREALFNAVSENNELDIKVLLGHTRIDHNKCINYWGAMPIHHAAWNGKLAAIKTLAAFNQDLLKVKTIGGWSVLDTAVGSEHLTTENKMKTIDALVQAGLDIRPWVSDPIFLERHARFPQIVEYLKILSRNSSSPIRPETSPRGEAILNGIIGGASTGVLYTIYNGALQIWLEASRRYVNNFTINDFFRPNPIPLRIYGDVVVPIVGFAGAGAAVGYVAYEIHTFFSAQRRRSRELEQLRASTPTPVLPSAVPSPSLSPR